MKEIPVGFWWSTAEPNLPMPVADSSTLTAEQTAQVLVYLRAGKISSQYKGFSRCRLHTHNNCKHANMLPGSADLTDGTYVWPEALPHYIEHHRVALPIDFINHILSKT